MRLKVVKPLGFEWMKRLYDYIKSQPHLVSNIDCLIIILTPLFMYQI